MNERTENRASRVLAHYELLVSQRRYDEAVSLYAHGMVAIDLRSGVSAPLLGSADLERALRITFDLYDFFDSLNIAVRGECLVLSRIALRTHDGFEVPFLQLFEIDDSDKIRSTTHFDDVARDDAIPELESRNIALGAVRDEPRPPPQA